MRSPFSLAAILLAAVAASQCSSGNDQNATPATPTAPANTPTAVTVSIVGTNGNKSYVPNPVATASGEQIVFKNNDSVVHRIMMDDGSIDFGNISPGSSSSAKSVGAGGNFHCTIHPSMVGSINGAVAPEPTPGSGDGY